MKTIIRILMLLILFLQFGCAATNIDYAWEPFPITQDRLTLRGTFSKNTEIEIIKGSSNKEKVLLAEYKPFLIYYGSQQQLTDAIVSQLSSEMQKEGLKIIQSAPKSLKITVERTSFEEGISRLGVTIEFTVKLGDGKSIFYTVTNKTPTAFNYAFNGAVALAVIKIMNDPQIEAYINQ